MTNRMLGLLLVPLGLAGCAVHETARTMDFDLTLRNYGSALRWAYFDTAASAIRPRPGDPPPQPCVPRTDVRVSSFQPRDVQFGPNLDEAQVRAALAYVELVSGVVRDQRLLDPLIGSALQDDWALSRLDSTVRAILRAGTFELKERKDVPIAVIVTEYVEIAKAFFEDEEPKLVNAVLDRIAKQLRPDTRK